MDKHPDTVPPETSTDSIRIREVMQARKTVNRFQGAYIYDDLKTDGPLVAHWEFRPETTGFSITGHLEGTMLMECARCLSEFAVPTQLELNERYVFSMYMEAAEREKELQAEDFYEVIDEQGDLDLKDLAHQFLIMESINHTLCQRPECE